MTNISSAIDNAVEPGLQQLEEDLTRDAAPVARGLKRAAELPLKETILVAKLLLFRQCEAVFAVLPTASFRTMHAGRVCLSFKVFGGAE